MTPEGEALLLSGGSALGLDLRGRLPAFAQLQAALMAGNAHMNLTALTTEPDIVLKHFIDSLTCDRRGWLTGDLGPVDTVVDLGSGAGFPTLPLAIVYPALKLLAVDGTRKKTVFVAQTAAALGLSNVSVLAGRAEQLSQQPAHREQYARVVARALAPLPVLAELGLPLLKLGGLLIAQKGQLGQAELAAGKQAAALLGGELFHVEHFELPVTGDPRSLVVIRKTGATPGQYPRRAGVPARQPLC